MPDQGFVRGKAIAHVAQLNEDLPYVQVWLALSDGRRVVFHQRADQLRLSDGRLPEKGAVVTLTGSGRLPDSVWIGEHLVFRGSHWWSGRPPANWHRPAGVGQQNVCK